MTERIALLRTWKPVHYKLSLRDLDFQAWTFKGRVSIDLQVTEATKVISLNAEEIKITKTELVEASNDASRAIQSNGRDYQEDVVAISFEQELPAAKAYKLSLEYEGVLNAQSMGFYRAQYKTLSEPPASVGRAENGSAFMVCTQFQAVGARRAFPCFDEPNMKATFAVDIELPADQTAVSNMPVEKTEETTQSLKRVSFETTPIMSTYLLAWGVGDFKYLETFTEQEYRGSKIPVRFYAIAGLEEQGRYVMEEAAKAIDFFSKSFDIEYPLAKMDILAISEFTVGAMENWGLIAGKTNVLTFDEGSSAASKKQTIVSVIWHEVAHQWFGNLVTMDWWDELWLNEGFATWAEHYATSLFKPDWNTWESFMSQGMEFALNHDSMRSSHPIHGDVPDARNVHEVFDLISYQKSCAVINMIANHMGADTFLKGVSNYLKQNMYKNATANDLWRALGEASGDDIVNNIKPWIEKIGHPVLTVTEESGQLTLKQSRFLAVDDMKPEEDETIWWIPLGFRRFEDNKSPSVPSALSEREISVSIPKDSLYLFNASGTGFYRIEYPQGHLTKLGQKRAELTAAEKLTTLNSASALAFSGSGSSVSLLGFMQAFAEETDPQVWTRMLRDFTRLRGRFDDDAEILPAIKRLIRTVTTKTAQELGWKKVEGESPMRSDLRRAILDESLRCDSPEIEETAQQKSMRYMAEPEKLDVDQPLRYLVWGAAAKASPKDTVPKLLRQWQESASAETRVRLVRAMGMAQDPEVLQTIVLPFCFDATPEDRVLDQTEMQPLMAMLGLQATARHLQWTYMKEHWDAIAAKMGTPEAINRLLFVLAIFNTAADVEDIDKFFADKNTNGFAMTLARSKDGIMNVQRFRNREREPLAAFLREQGYMTPQ